MNFYANPEKIGHTLRSLTDNVYIIHRVLTTRLILSRPRIVEDLRL